MASSSVHGRIWLLQYFLIIDSWIPSPVCIISIFVRVYTSIRACVCSFLKILKYSILRPPPKGLPGVIDQTRGLLTYVEQHCAKAVYTPELRYVCIAGR